MGASNTIEKMPKALFSISDLYLIEARDTQENQDDFIKDKQFSNVKVLIIVFQIIMKKPIYILQM